MIAYMAGAQDQITSVAYEAAKEIAEHTVAEHGVPEEVVVKAPSDDLSEWLRKIGGDGELLEYVDVLKREGFGTLESMKNMGEDDLDALGVKKRGHRKTLLAGIAALKGKQA